MEALNNYNFREYDFTVWFFKILLGIVATAVLLVFVLQINETIAVKEGEIVASNPQQDYKAPFEAQVTKINVKEGQHVNSGDTLVVMQNTDYPEQEFKAKKEIEFLEKKLESFAVLENALRKKKAALDQTSEVASRKYQLDINRLVSDMRSLDQQYGLQKEMLASAQEKYAGDSILYRKDMLSKYEFNNTKEANLNLKQNLNTVQNQRNKQRSEKSLVYNNFTQEQNSLLLNKIQLEENAQALIEARNEYELQILQAKETFKGLQKEVKKQYVVANTAGVVNYLFNTKLSSNLLNKGDLLVSIAPQAVSYYAKVFLPEKDMFYIKEGLAANLKLDAYQRLQRGPINGKVSYVAERKDNDKFYALVQLSETDKFRLKPGYTVYGEIVVERLPLYKYFIKKLLKRFEQA